MTRVEVTAPMIGLVYMQVCAAADATDEEILETCNRQNPSGTSAGWTIVYRSGGIGWWHSSDRNLAPVRCADHPGRMHFLVSC